MARPKGTTTLERSPTGGRCCVSAWIDYTDKAALRRIAKRDGKRVSEIIRTYIVWGIEHDKR